MKRICIHIVLLSVLIGFISCKGSTSTVTTSNIARLTAFAFAKQDSFPGLAEATFKVEELLDTGVVYVLDSIRYGTPINKVRVNMTFEKTPGAVVMKFPDTTIMMSGYDTLDFSKRPVYMTVTSSDLTTKKTYEIQAYVHQTDPDLYVWNTLTDEMYDAEDEEQQVVLLNGQFCLFSNNGYSNRLLISDDGETWEEQIFVGLPASCRVKAIVSDGERLYYAVENTLYTSDDAINWTSSAISQDVIAHTMLMHFNDEMWLILEDTTEQLLLGRIEADTVAKTDIMLDADFPISGFATVEFENLSTRKRAMVVGGFARNGACVNSRWNFEYSPTLAQPYRLVNYSIEQPEFTTLTGVSVVWYKHQLLMFGGVDKNMVFLGNDVLVSNNEGYTWTKADTSKCHLPETYTPRQKQSVIVKDNYIYVFGGQNLKETFVDAYRGRLNSIDWEGY